MMFLNRSAILSEVAIGASRDEVRNLIRSAARDGDDVVNVQYHGRGRPPIIPAGKIVGAEHDKAKSDAYRLSWRNSPAGGAIAAPRLERPAILAHEASTCRTFHNREV